MADTQLPGVFGDVQPLLEHYGYLGVGGLLFLEDFGVPVPGEIMLIAAAVFAGAGHMNIAVVFLVAVLAAVIGDNIGFIVGHFGGRPLVRALRPLHLLDPASGSTSAETTSTATAARSSPSPASSTGCARSTGCWPGSSACTGRSSWRYNALGAVLWVGTWVALGYLAGEHIVEIYAAFERYKWYVFAAVVVVVAIVITHRVQAQTRRAHGLVLCRRDSGSRRRKSPAQYLLSPCAPNRAR